jgi:hypothetical protein
MIRKSVKRFSEKIMPKQSHPMVRAAKFNHRAALLHEETLIWAREKRTILQHDSTFCVWAACHAGSPLAPARAPMLSFCC